MKRTMRNQSGFGFVEGLVALSVVVIISLIGYTLVTSKTMDDVTPAHKSAKSTVKTQAPAPTKAADSPATKYLAIKEWGVELPLNEGLADAYYAKLSATDVSEEMYGLSTRSLQKLDPACAAEKMHGALIIRQSEAKRNANIKQNNDYDYPVYDTKIDNYYYGFDRTRAACSSDQKVNDEQVLTYTRFKNAFEGLRAIE